MRGAGGVSSLSARPTTTPPPPLRSPFGFADGFSDHGILQTLFSRTVRLILGNSSGLSPAAASAWVLRRMPILGAMANLSLTLRANATANTPPGVTRGLIWGNPEHDTCHSPDYYYHNNVRG